MIRAFGPDCVSRMTNTMFQRINKYNKVAYIKTVTEK